MRYEFQGPGSPKNTPVEVTVRELDRIKERDGGISPVVVVEESRPEDAPLHPEFEWDDPIAAQKYREVQARQIIRSVVLVSQPELNETAPVIRAFVSVHNPAGNKPQSRLYKPTLDVLRDPDESEQVKKRFRNELLAMRQRYMALLETDEALQATLNQLVEAI